ncbi:MULTISPECIES: hypothetical protein [unclassified Paenibacillus]|uniref:hypothetical protein n=1 Tax=unclassified Paenibacillus TaxID=185978 RepID=UPI0024058838|nr:MULTISPECIES: hypothetical protein [unclassified Paenibacillus]MDF9843708.1 hypothetical protein [Paenibacillus sp. PastF-2]MDF9850297.1 hypothetical protein [Paenibacillus sp. PastM-2]MDF9856763.1 hypothetical protein [Paenibacillus sp. PastF-1]MDH6482143.1 hypothetical protein [Paenibacillus sp. PastH-2]MDH6509564.1 hypothetical protein [Paenibacillus sp. PastM-3]
MDKEILNVYNKSNKKEASFMTLARLSSSTEQKNKVNRKITAQELGRRNSLNDLAGKKLVEIYKEGK